MLTCGLTWIAYFDTNGDEELRLKLDDDVRWITPHHIPGFYNHPEGRKPFDLGLRKPLTVRPALC